LKGDKVVENNEATKVSATLGYTLNLGNFQSLRVDLGVVDHVRDGETTKTAMDRVYNLVESEVIQKVQDAREALVEE
jgi:hypothetical protein